MVSVLEAFKIQPFDLEPVYASWPDAPRFHGKPKKDLPVDEWLARIKEGCIARKVPKEYWYRVGQSYLEGKAKGRFAEVKAVMQHMHGGRYTWNWKNFKVAMRNMGWDVDSDKTEEIEVQSKSSGIWAIIRRGKDKEPQEASPSPPPPPPKPAPPQRSNTWDVPSLRSMMPIPRRSQTMNTIETVSSPAASAKSSSKNVVATPPSAPSGPPNETVTTIAQAPLWLLNACQSLDFLATEHPKVMTAISAVLITVGSIPALPVISAGAGGAFLASGTAHALGSIAVGLGTLLKATSDGQVQAIPGQPVQGNGKA